MASRNSTENKKSMPKHSTNGNQFKNDGTFLDKFLKTKQDGVKGQMSGKDRVRSDNQKTDGRHRSRSSSSEASPSVMAARMEFIMAMKQMDESGVTGSDRGIGAGLVK
eukprot:GHVL01025709.1.p1 GENE.GHVL01025709.1~~GHVL01025709.1.p1  ORF type:complete len:108 (+),score=14.01 GHVL01025709.1:57-380(+)